MSDKTREGRGERQGEAGAFKVPTGKARRGGRRERARERSVSSEGSVSRASEPGSVSSVPGSSLAGQKRKAAPSVAPNKGAEGSPEPPPLKRSEVWEALIRGCSPPEGKKAQKVWDEVGRDLEALDSFRVWPTNRNEEGVPLRSLELARHAIGRVRDATDYLWRLADGSEMEESEVRIDTLQREVASLKYEVRRLKKEVLASRAREERLRSASSGHRSRAKVAAPRKGGGVKGPVPKPRPRVGKEGRGATRSVSRPQPAPSTSKEGAPPRSKTEGEWSKVERRKRRKAAEPRGRDAVPAPKPKGARQVKAPAAPSTREKKRRAVPQTAAVTVTAIGERSYADIMKGARERVSIADLGITDMTLKRARNGGYLFEIPGADGPDKADRLARDLEEVLCGEAIVARPVKSAELRVTGLDDSASLEEVERAICATGECARSSLRMGNIRRAANGLGAVWVRCPLAAALRLEKAGRLKVGWTHAVVRLLEERPLQCYKCLLWGHTAAACKGQVDRSGRCFNCGGAGHVARECAANSRCPLCDVAGEQADHRMGGPSCAALKRVAGRRKVPSRKRQGQKGKSGGDVTRTAGGAGPKAASARPARPPQPAVAPPPTTRGSEELPPPGLEEGLFTQERQASPGTVEMPPSQDRGEKGVVITIDDDPSQVPVDLDLGDWDSSP